MLLQCLSTCPYTISVSSVVIRSIWNAVITAVPLKIDDRSYENSTIWKEVFQVPTLELLGMLSTEIVEHSVE